VSGPGNGTRDSWQVMADRRSRFEILIVSFNLVDLSAVVGEQELILSVQGSSQVLSVKDRLKLPKEL
jgi:hypothetical protein